MADALLDLARPGVRIGEAALGFQPERQVRDEPLGRVQEAKLARLVSGDLADDAEDDVAFGRVVGHATAFTCLGERFEMRLHGVDLRHGGGDRLLDLIRHLVRLLQPQLAGQLEVQRDLRPAADVQHADVVDLAHARDSERGGVCTVADGGLVLLRLDVDDDVTAGQRVVQCVLDAVGRGVTLADRCARGNRDHDVGELPRAGLAHAEAPERDRGLDSSDRRARRLLGGCRDAVHQHVDVALHQPRGGDQHERGDEERRGRVRAHVARTYE